jgi:hypothetical protein
MQDFIFNIGMFGFAFGLFGGFEFLSQKTQMRTLSTMNRDQAMLLFGWTWMLMGMM